MTTAASMTSPPWLDPAAIETLLTHVRSSIRIPKQCVRIHVAVAMLAEAPRIVYSSPDAWPGAADLALQKAAAALAASSRENAETTRSLATVDRTLMPGGVPLYDESGSLMGGLGVAGDGPDQDETVAVHLAGPFLLRAHERRLTTWHHDRHLPFVGASQYCSDREFRAVVVVTSDAERPTALTDDDIRRLVDGCVHKAQATASGRRKDRVSVRIHVAVATRRGGVHVVHSMDDAIDGGRQQAIDKAVLALDFSSDGNATSTRSLGHMLPALAATATLGGFPLYRDGRLIGAVGVAGDAPDIDEAVAVAGTRHARLEAPEALQTVLPYDADDVVVDVVHHVTGLNSGTTSSSHHRRRHRDPEVTHVDSLETWRQSSLCTGVLYLSLAGDRSITSASDILVSGAAATAAHVIRRLDLFHTRIRDLALLPTLVHLETLNLSRTQVGDAQMPYVAQLRRLRVLELNGVRELTDRGLAHVADLVGLEELGLACTHVRDVRVLQTLVALWRLDLHWTDVESVAPLRVLPRLRDVDVTGTRVADTESLRHVRVLNGEAI